MKNVIKILLIFFFVLVFTNCANIIYNYNLEHQKRESPVMVKTVRVIPLAIDSFFWPFLMVDLIKGTYVLYKPSKNLTNELSKKVSIAKDSITQNQALKIISSNLRANGQRYRNCTVNSSNISFIGKMIETESKITDYHKSAGYTKTTMKTTVNKYEVYCEIDFLNIKNITIKKTTIKFDLYNKFDCGTETRIAYLFRMDNIENFEAFIASLIIVCPKIQNIIVNKNDPYFVSN